MMHDPIAGSPAPHPRALPGPLRALKRAIPILIGHRLAMVRRFEVSTPLIALTFDDGPHPQFTARLLRLLERFKVHATFFVLGEAAAQHPALIADLARAGHVIANHSWNHPHFPTLRGHERRKQLRACHRATAPHGIRLFRPPWGKFDLASSLDALRLRYTTIGWSLDVGDWWDRDSERMAELLSRASPGDIILLHDALFAASDEGAEPPLNPDRDSMLRALAIFLERHAHRFRFATVPEMFRFGRPQRFSL